MIYLLIVIIFVAFILKKLVKVPDSLKDVPRISIWTMVKSIYEGKTVQEFFDEVVGPEITKRGYALFWNRGGWSIIISKPSLIKQVLKQTQVFTKFTLPHYSLNVKFTGKRNIVRSDGEEWRRYRRPVNSIFHQSFQPDMFAECVKATMDVVTDRINEFGSKPFPVSDLMEYMTLDILGKGIMSYDFDAIKGMGSAHYHHLYNSVFNAVQDPLYISFPILERLPFTSRPKLLKQADNYNKFIEDLIIQRRQDIKDGKIDDSGDILSLMIKHDPDSPYEPWTNEELIANLNIFIIAGHDTTAHTLSYGMYYLAKNQHVQDKLRKEVQTVLNISQDQDQVKIPTADELKEMSYLACFIKETMRMSPAVINIPRRVEDDVHIPEEGLTIPKDTLLSLSVYGVQHNPEIFPDPYKFEPERFLNCKYDTDVYLPFGGGSRICIGMSFSLMEQKVYLTMLLQKFIIQIREDNPDYDQLRVVGLGFTKTKDLNLNFEPRF